MTKNEKAGLALLMIAVNIPYGSTFMDVFRFIVCLFAYFSFVYIR